MSGFMFPADNWWAMSSTVTAPGLWREARATSRVAAIPFFSGSGLKPRASSLFTSRIKLTAAAAMMAVAAATGSAAAAAEAGEGCIELSTAAETEQQYLDEQGHKATRLVPASKVVPGDEVVWTITAKNVCRQPAGSVVVANPVPQHMAYVAASALGIGTDIAFSLDGQQFEQPAGLKVHEADGSARAARADEYRHIRWIFKDEFAPGAVAFVRYRAVVK